MTVLVGLWQPAELWFRPEQRLADRGLARHHAGEPGQRPRSVLCSTAQGGEAQHRRIVRWSFSSWELLRHSQPADTDSLSRLSTLSRSAVVLPAVVAAQALVDVSTQHCWVSSQHLHRNVLKYIRSPDIWYTQNLLSLFLLDRTVHHRDELGRDHFLSFLEREYATENLLFVESVWRLKKLSSCEVADQCEVIWHQFMAPTAEHPVNVDSKSYKITQQNMENPDRYIYSLLLW